MFGLHKNVHFLVTILTYTFGNRWPPPPRNGNNSQNFLFSPIFFWIFQILNQELCDEIDQISPPHYCKTCFWHLRMILAYKKHLVNLQKFWDLRRPPPPLWEKFPKRGVASLRGYLSWLFFRLTEFFDFFVTGGSELTASSEMTTMALPKVNWGQPSKRNGKTPQNLFSVE